MSSTNSSSPTSNIDMQVALVKWAASELTSEADDAIATANVPALDDAVLDALGVLMMYYASLPQERAVAALEAYNKAQADRNRPPLPGLQHVTSVIRELRSKLCEIGHTAVTRPKNRRFLDDAIASWGSGTATSHGAPIPGRLLRPLRSTAKWLNLRLDRMITACHKTAPTAVSLLSRIELLIEELDLLHAIAEETEDSWPQFKRSASYHRLITLAAAALELERDLDLFFTHEAKLVPLEIGHLLVSISLADLQHRHDDPSPCLVLNTLLFDFGTARAELKRRVFNHR